MNGDTHWYDSPGRFIGIGLLTGSLLGALLWGAKWILDDWLQDTPTHQARVGIQPHRPIVLTYDVPAYVKDQPALVFYVKVEETATEVQAGIDKDNPKVNALESGDAIKVFAPDAGKFKLEVWSGFTVKGSFEIEAKPDNSIGDTVLEPLVSNPFDRSTYHVSTVTLKIKNHTGSFVILEK